VTVLGNVNKNIFFAHLKFAGAS